MAKVYKGRPGNMAQSKPAKPRRSAGTKTPFKLIGGPWEGKRLFLTCADTMPISISGWRGVYKSSGPGELTWVNLKA